MLVGRVRMRVNVLRHGLTSVVCALARQRVLQAVIRIDYVLVQANARISGLLKPTGYVSATMGILDRFARCGCSVHYHNL